MDILNDLLKDLFYLVLLAGFSALIKYGIPWLGKFIKTWLIDRLVAAAEQKIQGTKMGADRKAWVNGQLDSLHIKLDGFVNAMIEASVFKLNQKQIEIATAKTSGKTIEYALNLIQGAYTEVKPNE